MLKIKFETFDGQTEELNHRPPRHILRCPLREKIHFPALNKHKKNKICLSLDRFVYGMQRDPSKKGPSNNWGPFLWGAIGILSINFKFQVQRTIIGGPFNQFKSLRFREQLGQGSHYFFDSSPCTFQYISQYLLKGKISVHLSTCNTKE